MGSAHGIQAGWCSVENMNVVVTLKPLTVGWMDFLDIPSPLQEAVVQPPDRSLPGKLYPGQSLPLCCTMPAGDFQEQPGVCGVIVMYASMVFVVCLPCTFP